MNDEQARRHLKKHCAAWGDAKYEPARWVVEALQSAVAEERRQCAIQLEQMDLGLTLDAAAQLLLKA